MKKQNKKDQIKRLLAACTSIIVLLIAWQLGVMFTDLGLLLPSPITVMQNYFKSFLDPIGPYTMVGHILVSLGRLASAFFFASALGITVGLAMGWYRTAKAIINPFFLMFRPIPPIAWIPMAIVWFGFSEWMAIFLICISVMNNTIINAYHGARNADQTLVGAARMLGASERKIFTTIVLPAAVPSIFAGLHNALSSGFAVAVAAEMTRSKSGLGWIIAGSMGSGNTVQTFIGLISIGIVGFILAIVMRGVESKLCAWNKREI